MLFRDRTRCPSCGERVTPYAAGCAICGADLDPKRWQPRPSLPLAFGLARFFETTVEQIFHPDTEELPT